VRGRSADRIAGVGAKAGGAEVRGDRRGGTAAREFLHYLDRNGTDAEPLLLKAQLSRGQLEQDPGGISFGSQDKFLELAAMERNGSLLGLR
jgi:hypothetical protein